MSDRTRRIHVQAVLVADATPVRLEAYLSAGVRRDDQSRVFVSHAPALDLFSQGRTEREALRAIENAVRLYLVSAHEHGMLTDILARLDVTPALDEVSGLQDYVRVVDVAPAVAP